MSRRSPNTIRTCYVCVRRRPCEREHVWPVRFGGKSTAPICVSCHDGIDRVLLDDLSFDEGFEGVAALGECFGTAWLVNLHTLVRTRNDRPAALKALEELLREWDGLAPQTRVIGTKLLRIVLQAHDPWDSEPSFVTEFCEAANDDV